MPYAQVTLATLRAQLERRYDAVPYWTTAEANAAINEALRCYNLLTGFWKRRVLIATTANTVFYALPSTLIFDVRTEFNQVTLEQSSISDLNNGRVNWRAETTATGGTVPTSVKMWAPVGLTRLAIWPAHAAGGGTLIVDGVRQTPVLTADADFVDLGQVELDALLGYALHVLAFKLGGTLFQATLPLYRAFIEACGDQNVRLKSSTWYRRAMGIDLQRKQHPVRVIPPPQPQQVQEGAQR